MRFYAIESHMSICGIKKSKIKCHKIGVLLSLLNMKPETFCMLKKLIGKYSLFDE